MTSDAEFLFFFGSSQLKFGKGSNENVRSRCFVLHLFTHDESRSSVTEEMKLSVAWTSSWEMEPVVIDYMASRGAYLLAVWFMNGRLIALPVTQVSKKMLLSSSPWWTLNCTVSGYPFWCQDNLSLAEWLNVLRMFMCLTFGALGKTSNPLIEVLLLVLLIFFVFFYHFLQEKRVYKGCRLLGSQWYLLLAGRRRDSVSNTYFLWRLLYACLLTAQFLWDFLWK